MATETEKGQPVATIRTFGKGKVIWLATGSRVMDFGIIDKVHKAAKDLWTFGRDIQEDADLKWLRNPHVRQMLLALTRP